MAGVQLGETQRGINQGNMDANFQEFMRRINQPGQNLGALQGIMGASPYGTTQTTTSEGNWMNTLGGLVATGASFFGGTPPNIQQQAGGAGGAGAGGGSSMPGVGYQAGPNPFGTSNFGFGG